MFCSPPQTFLFHFILFSLPLLPCLVSSVFRGQSMRVLENFPKACPLSLHPLTCVDAQGGCQQLGVYTGFISFPVKLWPLVFYLLLLIKSSCGEDSGDSQSLARFHFARVSWYESLCTGSSCVSFVLTLPYEHCQKWFNFAHSGSILFPQVMSLIILVFN